MRMLIAFLLTCSTAAAGAAPSMKASDLIGLPVLERGSGAAGRIGELVVDIPNNRVHYAVVDLERRRVALPMQAIAFSAALDRATFGPHAPAPVPPRAGMSLARASALLGWPFESRGGVGLGRVQDFVVELDRGDIPFALVRLQGEDALRGVPLDAFSVSAHRAELVSGLTREDLALAPSFSERGLDEGLQDPQFVQRHAAVADRLGAAGPAAGATSPADRDAVFLRLDRNGDGVISREEFEALRPE